MRAILQRVKYGRLSVESKLIAEIGGGLLVLLGIAEGDSDNDIDWLVKKIVNLRIFDDGEGKLNKSILNIGGEILLVSQFTLFADCRKGCRPSFDRALRTDSAEKLFDKCRGAFINAGVDVKRGVFGADMDIELLNCGPVTISLDSKAR